MTYALAIYHLNLLLAFLTPKIDPAYAEFEAAEAEAEGGADTDGMALPTRQSDEFRPFIRRLPEFKFWYSATKATVTFIIIIQGDYRTQVDLVRSMCLVV